MRSVLKYLSTGFLAALILLPVGAGAQDNRTVPSSHTEMQLSFAPLVKRTAGAVVNVYAERVVQRRLSPLPAILSSSSSSASRCRTARKNSRRLAPA